MNLEDQVLERLRPTPRQRRAMEQATQRLLQCCKDAIDACGATAEPSLQGSIAKDTWLAGTTDIDVFLLVPPETPEHRLSRVVEAVAQQALEAPRARYAQHPYLVGGFEGMQVDLVPAYAVEAPSKRMSAVDRTPFHTAWVRSHLDAALRDGVRLTKQWLQGVEAYGAQTSVAGFSGYLVEVLVWHLGSFERFVAWLASGAQPRRFGELEDDAPLVVEDPVDAARNCAAAVSEETLARACSAARAYQEDPRETFFFPRPPRSEPGRVLRAALQARRETWLGIEWPDAAERLDIVFPQFQKTAHRLQQMLTEAGFTVFAGDTWSDERMVGMQWRLDAHPLPASRIHHGPPSRSPHAQRFRQKWQDHPDAASGVEEAAGRLQVLVRRHHRTPATWLRAHMPADLGRHVQAALPRARVLDDPSAVGPPWSPRVADFVLDRAPWQR